MSVIRGIVGLFSMALLAGMVLLNPLFTGWVGGFVTAENMRSEGLNEVREKYFVVICTNYFEADFLERWFSVQSWENTWCEDYKHRL